MRISLALMTLLITLAPAAFGDPRTPAPRDFDPQSWLSEHSRQQRVLISQEIRVCFLGDSITAFWSTEGKGAWQIDLSPFSPANCGIAGDRVEQVHYRARLLKLGDDPPEIFVILAGTNNLGKVPPDDPNQVAAGINSLALTLRRKYPDSKILVLSVLPSGLDPYSRLRKDIRKVNGNLSRGRLTNNYQFLDVHDRFVDSSGKWRPGLSIDGTHLTSRGYDVLAAPLAAKLSEILGEESR